MIENTNDKKAIPKIGDKQKPRQRHLTPDNWEDKKQVNKYLRHYIRQEQVKQYLK